jgi:hypothetical protein
LASKSAHPLVARLQRTMMSPGANWFDSPLVSMMTLLPWLEVSKLPATSVARGKLSVTFSASTSATSTRGRPRTTAEARTHRKLSSLAS